MSLGYEGRVAIVTGAARGLGRAHALLLASRGASVVVCDLGGELGGSGASADPAQSVASEIVAAGGTAIAVIESVADSAGGEAIVQAALDAFGRIDIVINNAGIVRDRTFHNLTDDDIDAVFRVHLYGAFNVTRPAWKVMREQRYGRVLNTTSTSGILGNFGQSNYGAAKMGLVGLTRVQALEGAKYGIQVNALAPIARTRMTEEVLGDYVEHMDPALASPAAAWLVHEDCTATGEVFSAFGGRVARVFIGVTKGYYNPDARGLTVEDVRDNFEQVRGAQGYFVPEKSLDEVEYFLTLIDERKQPVA